MHEARGEVFLKDERGFVKMVHITLNLDDDSYEKVAGLKSDLSLILNLDRIDWKN